MWLAKSSTTCLRFLLAGETLLQARYCHVLEVLQYCTTVEYYSQYRQSHRLIFILIHHQHHALKGKRPTALISTLALKSQRHRIASQLFLRNFLLNLYKPLETLDVLLCSLHVQASVAALSLLKARLPGRFPTELTGLWTGLTDDRKWRRDVAEALLRARLLNGPEMDAHLAKILQMSRSSSQTVEFAVHMVSTQLDYPPHFGRFSESLIPDKSSRPLLQITLLPSKPQ